MNQEIGAPLKVRSLTLEGFRSFEAERIDFEDITFLVGRNGSGKSNLVDAFRFLSSLMRSSVDKAVQERGGIQALYHQRSLARSQGRFAMRIDFESREGTTGYYAFRVSEFNLQVVKEQCRIESVGSTHWFDRSQNRLVTSEQDGPSLVADTLALPAFGPTTAFGPIFATLSSLQVYSLLPAQLRAQSSSGSRDPLLPDGSNLVAVISNLEEKDINLLSNWLSSMVPGIRRVRVERIHMSKVLFFEQDSQPFDMGLNNMSDGTLRILSLITAALQKRPPSLMAFEEPETNLHPGVLRALSDLLGFASQRTQVIVTTHSPEILDAKWIEDRHLRIVHWENGTSRVSRIPEGARRALQEHLFEAGELLRSEVLDAPPLPLREEPLPSLFEELR